MKLEDNMIESMIADINNQQSMLEKIHHFNTVEDTAHKNDYENNELMTTERDLSLNNDKRIDISVSENVKTEVSDESDKKIHELQEDLKKAIYEKELAEKQVKATEDKVNKDLNKLKKDLERVKKEKQRADIKLEKAEVKASAEKEKSKKAKRIQRSIYWETHKNTVIRVLISVIGIAATVLISSSAYIKAKSAASTAYSTAFDQRSKAVYDSFYDRSYEFYERTHHVQNIASINISNITETSRLAVLTVRELQYVTKNNSTDYGNILESIKNKVTGYEYCLAIPGDAIYTVNMQAAEVIVDEARVYVLIRIPNPVPRVAIDYSSIQTLAFNSKGELLSSQKTGGAEMREQLKKVQSELELSVMNNQEYYNMAKKHAEDLLIQLVHQFNPGLDNLTVKVEFVD